MQAQMNVKIKFREGFRPFAPSVLSERVSDYFEIDCDSPYMLLVAPVSRNEEFPDWRTAKALGHRLAQCPDSDVPRSRTSTTQRECRRSAAHQSDFHDSSGFDG